MRRIGLGLPETDHSGITPVAHLALHAGQVLSREQLLEQVWGYDYYGDLRAVDAAIKRLRARLREVASEAEVIATMRGRGYKLSR